MKDQKDIDAIIEELKRLYPEAECSLTFDPEKAYELLFSVRLAAQCTDARVNLVTPVLYSRFPTLQSLAEASEEEVGEIIHSTGFWRAKARDIVAASRMLLSEFGGKVPDNMEDLLRLPGVGRKTANLILGDVYGKEGYVCDTHCIRITGLLGITDGSKDPLKVEMQLRACIPPEESNDFCHRMVLHGRAVCVARRPDCEHCTLRLWCDHGSAAGREAAQ
ncbi:MAG TPA: endonuclease III [Candidatus Pelethomonas intestinigallinarum]|nr:endonuclease III [Candidatus Pelethomonas intestinigallinarum]